METIDGAVGALDRRAGTIGRQGDERRRFRQIGLPKIEMRLQKGVAKALSLPDCIVGILNGRVRQLRLGIEIKGLKLLQKHVHGPAVRDDVVEDHSQEMIFRGQTPDRHANQRPAGEIEGRPGQFPGLAQSLREAGLLIQPAQISDSQGDAQIGQDVLDRSAILFPEQGAQAGVSGDDAVDGRFQSGQIQRPAQAHRSRNVINRGIGIELVQEPETLLGRREGGGGE